MYSSLKNIQILISLLKKYHIKHLVISPGGRSTPFVHSVEQDDFFKIYSIVDERSASFFALGLTAELKEPVAVCCSSGTAVANHVSAACEAFYQQLPLLIISADRNHNYMYQQEEQMVPQEKLMEGFSKKIITLEHVRDEKDFWYASRICNEALLELTTGEKGPVHINYIVENDYPVHHGIVKFEEENLPDVKKIDRLSLEDSEDKWMTYVSKFKNSKILIIYGQNSPLEEDEIGIIEDFASKYNCVISTDLLSNLNCKYSVPTFTLSRMINTQEREDICPDIIITMNANSVSEIKNSFNSLKNRFEHIHVSQKGQISDPYKKLSDIIACSPIMFFKKFAQLAGNGTDNHSYYEKIKSYRERIGINGSLNSENIEYSALFAIQQLMKNIPENSLLHLANSMSVRFANFFDLKKNIDVYCNRGTNGIDGSMSSFIGQANVSNRPSFLIIGDLSFFYDMNALWNQYVGKNIRILVINNSGGAIFYNFPGRGNVPTVGQYIAAEHTTSIKDWVVSRGFKYLSASNKDETDSAIKELVNTNSDYPVILEVFTNKDEDIKSFNTILEHYKTPTLKQKVWDNIPEGGLKNTIREIMAKGK